jgi:hypothetical protein
MNIAHPLQSLHAIGGTVDALLTSFRPATGRYAVMT